MKKILFKLKNIKLALKISSKDLMTKVLLGSLGLNFLALDYLIFSQATTLRIFTSQNTGFYTSLSFALSIITAILFAISIVMLVYILKKKKEQAKDSAPTSLLGTIFGVVASGCPVCGAWLLPLLGVAGSLAAFPFQGLEVKLLAVILLVYSLILSADIILGVCSPENAKKRNRNMILMIIIFITIIFTLPNLPQKYKFQFQKQGVNAVQKVDIVNGDLEDLYNQVNPKKGFETDLVYGDIGYQLVQDGVIDLDKFKAVYDRAGTPLTKKQLKIFTKEGLNEKITINRENSYFLLNFFWAFGLANENPIITEGQITQYGKGKIGDFASTGGWTIAKKPLNEFMANSKLATLTPEQQKLLQKVAESVYRPCCGNSTAFPDCNHGMAMLGVLELMASNGATEDELYEASKYFLAFWYPNQMIDVATYFKITEDKDFSDVEAKIAVSEPLFSGRGWSGLKGWLNSNANSGQRQSPQGGGVRGVESSQAQGQRVAPQGGGGCGV